VAVPPSLLRQVLVPGLATLAITALRFVGELLEPPWFVRDAGGGGVLVGITWLAPVFGAVFALRLLRAGHCPARPVSALATMLLGTGFVGVAFAIAGLLMAPTPWAMAVGACGSLPAGVCAFHAWRELGRLLFAYAIAARLPVMALAFVDAFLGLGTHYGRLAEGAPEYSALPRALVLCLAQAVFWVPLTLVFGGLAGLLAVALGRRRARAQTAAHQTAAQTGRPEGASGHSCK
jgi:hypothetical protein